MNHWYDEENNDDFYYLNPEDVHHDSHCSTLIGATPDISTRYWEEQFPMEKLNYIDDTDEDSYYLRHMRNNFQADDDWNDDFDGRTCGDYRKEQHVLRSRLLRGSHEGVCSICGAFLPKEMLIAAHIKKRAECTPEEKGDLGNIATLMCDLGCDKLYERGYIGVKDGVVVILRNPPSYMSLQRKIKSLSRRRVSAWTPINKKYFDWHLNYFSVHRDRLGKNRYR